MKGKKRNSLTYLHQKAEPSRPSLETNFMSPTNSELHKDIRIENYSPNKYFVSHEACDEDIISNETVKVPFISKTQNLKKKIIERSSS